jgi:hydrogenase nickel incorporation protein HypB
MCDDCGCGDPEVVPLEVQERILSENDRRAEHNRHHFREAGVLALNLMGSPGSGKTALLEATARYYATRGGGRQGAPPQGGYRRLGAVSGDLATDNDSRRLERSGIASRSITTGSACHLDARLVHEALHGMAWRELDLFFIENVGNLVCPAVYDLGQEANVVALSVTEGEDKPLKYPVMFQKADLVVLTKTDLLPHLPGVSVDAIRENLARVMPEPSLIPLSAVTGEGLETWIDWLEARRVLAIKGPAREAAARFQGMAALVADW